MGGVAQGGKLSWRDFLKLWTAGSEYDKGIVSTMVGLSKAELKEIVREKIQQRLPGGPAGLRRAFQFIDGDGSGSIDEGELRRTLHETLGVSFEEETFRQVFADYSEGTGIVDYKKFVRNVIGSTVDDHTSFDTRAVTNSKVLLQKGNNADGNSEMFIRRAVREQWRNLQIALKHADQDETGEIPVAAVRKILERHNINVPDNGW